MKSNNFLHELINSLSKNEKGYFVKNNVHENALHLQLFQAILKQKNYEEKKLISEFNGTYIGNNFSYAKNYLYHSVIKSLLGFNNNKRDVYYYFESIKLLYQKGLYDQCSKMLKQITTIAEKTNDYLSVLKAIQYSKMLVHSNIHSNNFLDELVSKESFYIEKYQTISTYQSLLSQVKSNARLNTKSSIAQIGKLLEHPFLSNQTKIIDKYCEHMYHETLFLIGFILQDEILINKHIIQLEHFISDAEYSDNLNAYRKIDTLKQLIEYNILYRNFDSAEKNMQVLVVLLTSSKEINETETIAAYSYLYSFQTDLLLAKKEIRDVESLFKEINIFIRRNKNRIPVGFTSVILGNMLILQFRKRFYIETLSICKKLKKGDTKSVRKDILITTLLTEVAALYEINRTEEASKRLKSFQRYLTTNNVKERAWSIFADFYKRLIEGDQLHEAFDNLITKTKKLKSNRILLDLEFLVDLNRNKLKESQKE